MSTSKKRYCLLDHLPNASNNWTKYNLLPNWNFTTNKHNRLPSKLVVSGENHLRQTANFLY